MSDNELIAEFMQQSKDPDGTYHLAPEYDSSWDWLIPVVEKIESIHDDHHGYFGVHISSNGCSIQGTNLHLAIDKLSEYGAVYFSDYVLDSKLESTYRAVVEFIKWYKSKKSWYDVEADKVYKEWMNDLANTPSRKIFKQKEENP